MKKYMLDRYNKRINLAREKLGGKCVKCGGNHNLEFDHIDRETKSFTIAKGWNSKEDVFWQEISKCQLLCEECHKVKTLVDFGYISAKTSHGTLSSYRYCKCKDCRKAKANYMEEYRKTYIRKRDRK